MKERTEIDQQSLHFTYMEVASCRVYDDAKPLLNDLVVKELGRKYGDKYHFDEETDEWICDEVKYRNSNNPKEVKLAVIDAMTSFLNSRELISEEGTIAYEKSKAKDTSIIQFKRMDNDVQKVRDWLQRWQKEPAPIIKEEKAARLRPIKGKEYYVDIMFERLKELGYLNKDENKEAWRYLCGTNDDVPERPMKWIGTFFEFATLYEFFFVIRTCIFKTEGKGSIREFVVSQFGYDYENGFKQRLSRDYTRKPQQDKREAWNKMKDPQILFT